MYQLSDDQIEFVRRDIVAQGIHNESLQQDLLDHICCLIENELANTDDFKTFYHQRIKSFYNKELREIEEETLALLNFKNYYAIKKAMLISGSAAAILLVIALLLKFLYLPGVAIAMVLGVVLLNFVFLPSLLTLKIKENKTLQEKVLTGIATVSAMLISVGLILKLLTYSVANLLIVTGFGALSLIFLPIYFYTGVRRAETRVNTIVLSVIILSSSALLMIMLRSPRAKLDGNKAVTEALLRSENILNRQQQLANKIIAVAKPTDPIGEELNHLSENFKRFLLKRDTGKVVLDTLNQKYISETWVIRYTDEAPEMEIELAKIEDAIRRYNAALKVGLQRIPPIGDLNHRQIAEAIQDLIQVQLIISQNRVEQSLQQ